MNVIAKYARSLSSSNLKDDETNFQVEPIMAVAMSDMSGIGSLLWRIKYHEHLDLVELQKTSIYWMTLIRWAVIVEKKSKKENWNVKSVLTIAKMSFDYFLDDKCKSCGGTSFARHPANEQVLTNNPCPTCNGTAKRPLSGFKNQIEYIGNCVAMLETEERILGSLAVKKLAQEFDL